MATKKISKDEKEMITIYAGLAMNGLVREAQADTINPKQIAEDSYRIAEALIIEGRKYERD